MDRNHLLYKFGRILGSILFLLIASCAFEEGVDKAKFAELDRTSRELKFALSSGKPCDVQDSLRQRLSAGLNAVGEKAKSKADKDLVAAYSQLLNTLNDGLFMCNSRPLLTGFEFFQKDRIYVTQEIDPLVEKYDLKTEKHLFRHTGQYMRTVSGDSINVIWENALFQMKNIDNMLNYR